MANEQTQNQGVSQSNWWNQVFNGSEGVLLFSLWVQEKGGSENLSQGVYILNAIHFLLSNQHHFLVGFLKEVFNTKSKLSNTKTSSKFVPKKQSKFFSKTDWDRVSLWLCYSALQKRCSQKVFKKICVFWSWILKVKFQLALPQKVGTKNS